MAYGLVCRHCGCQETEHRDRWLAENPLRKVRGYGRTLAKCPGFAYRTKDHEILFEAYWSEGGPGIPDELSDEYEAFRQRTDPEDFRRLTLESIGNQNTAWAGFIGVRRLQKAQERAGVLRDAYRRAKPPEKKAIETEMRTLEKSYGEYFRYQVSR
jgi:hypothetical protein